MYFTDGGIRGSYLLCSALRHVAMCPIFPQLNANETKHVAILHSNYEALVLGIQSSTYQLPFTYLTHKNFNFGMRLHNCSNFSAHVHSPAQNPRRMYFISHGINASVTVSQISLNARPNRKFQIPQNDGCGLAYLCYYYILDILIQIY